MSVVVELSIFPLGKGESVSPYVSRALEVIRKSGLPYVLGPMGTCIEGEWEEVMAVVDACVQELRRDCDRIYLTLKADYRRGRSGRMGAKVAAVNPAGACGD